MPIAELTKQVPLPGLFLRFIGVAEVLGAVALILPGLLRIQRGLTPLAASGLVIIMTGATVITAIYIGAAPALMPLAVGMLAGFVAWGRVAAMPDTFRVERMAAIYAPANQIFDLISDFRHWASWSPFEKLDPAMKKTFSGAASGVGAVYNWEGNGKAGAGRMEIVEAVLPSKIAIKLDFLKPFEGHNTAEFTLDAHGGSTDVTWAMYGPQNFMFKVFSMFFSMDKMMGKDFSAGLANLKAIAEARTVVSK
jgi:uncharacterized protein YndB with AHSA1/START domain